MILKDRRRRQIAAIEDQLAGLINEHCELLGHTKVTCQYDREDRSLVLHPPALRDPDAPQET